ncbi:hypothetical protein OH720_09270 [Pseudomonas sp. WJP1]|uniref:hypothetical protein n=1 Tax=Pseudomonas sp. WJP1 TaxID=2986947 RepID=UPI002349371B|nr:hypothetical protein [Pseudomonas sp. WJP1]WCM53183.1 hypothetical protein OH720_09270 [Pseudomonas sp. WJP1]
MGIELGHGPTVGIAVGWQGIEPLVAQKCSGEGYESITGSCRGWLAGEGVLEHCVGFSDAFAGKPGSYSRSGAAASDWSAIRPSGWNPRDYPDANRNNDHKE